MLSIQEGKHLLGAWFSNNNNNCSTNNNLIALLHEAEVIFIIFFSFFLDYASRFIASGVDTQPMLLCGRHCFVQSYSGIAVPNSTLFTTKHASCAPCA